jgi:hypothetical protein
VRYYHRPGHPKASALGFVSEADLDDVGEETLAIHSPILVDRYMEGTAATDGTDIGSRGKRREYMKQKGLADADDFKNQWDRAKKEREAHYTEGGTDKDRRERKEALASAMREVREGRAKPTRHNLPE